MALKPLRPCRHPGCAALTREGYCPKHKPQKAPRRVSAEYHSWYSLPIWTDDLRPAQLLREPFCRECAAQYPPGDPRHRTRATVVDHINPTGGAGRCSSTRPTTRACANDAMTRKRHGSRQKNDGNETEFEASVGLEATSAPGCAGGHRGSCAGESLWLSRPTPTPRKFCGWGRKTAGPLVCEKMSPIRDLGGWR